jgi:hypothetical protein
MLTPFEVAERERHVLNEYTNNGAYGSRNAVSITVKRAAPRLVTRQPGVAA